MKPGDVRARSGLGFLNPLLALLAVTTPSTGQKGESQGEGRWPGRSLLKVTHGFLQAKHAVMDSLKMKTELTFFCRTLHVAKAPNGI
jgi:hypothetical protein